MTQPLPEEYLVEVPGEGCEEECECHDEAADDGRQPRRLPPAERHQQRRQQVRQAQVRRAHPHCKTEKQDIISNNQVFIMIYL